MRIGLTSVLVDDQERALGFYTRHLGFRKKQDFPAGEARWLTVVSPDQPEGVELLLEPAGPAFARSYQRSLFDAGLPAATFFVEDLTAEHARLEAEGVVFRTPPTPIPEGPLAAVLEDGCGNLVLLVEG